MRIPRTAAGLMNLITYVMEKSIESRYGALFLTLILATFFISCAQPIPVELASGTEVFGFWKGLLHGIILPFSFIGSLFKDDIAIYAINNNGAWYDFGFAFGASIIFGSGGKGASKKRKKSD